MRELFRFYCACAKDTHRATWIGLGVVSTVSGFPAAAYSIWGPTGSNFVNVLVVCLFFVIPLLCLLLVPWIQAFRLYQAKVAELATVEGKLTTLLRERSSPAEAAKTMLADLIRRGEILDNALHFAIDTPIALFDEASVWLRLAQDFVRKHDYSRFPTFSMNVSMKQFDGDKDRPAAFEARSQISSALSVLRQVQITA